MACMKEKSWWRRQTKPQRRVPKALNPNKSANKDSPRTLVAPPDISSRSGAKNLSSTPGQNNSSCLFSDYRKFFIVSKHLSEAALPCLDNPAIQIRLWIFWACHTIHHWRLLCFLLAYPNNPQTYSPKQRAKTRKFNETLWIPQTPMQWGQPACWGWGHWWMKNSHALLTNLLSQKLCGIDSSASPQTTHPSCFCVYTKF